MATGSNEDGAPDASSDQARANRENKHPLEYAIFVLLVLTFVATSLAACFTRNQWITAEDVERRQLRAYIGVVGNSYSVGNAAVTYKIKNYGTTPAHRFFICGVFTPITPGVRMEDVRLDQFQNCKYETVSQRPNNSLAALVSVWPGEERAELGRVLAPERLPDIRAGTMQAFILARIRYDDVFGLPHNTYVCRRYVPSQGDTPIFSGCHDGDGGTDD